MDPYNENMMTDVLRLVAAVCLVADGYVRGYLDSVLTRLFHHFNKMLCPYGAVFPCPERNILWKY